MRKSKVITETKRLITWGEAFSFLAFSLVFIFISCIIAPHKWNGRKNYIVSQYRLGIEFLSSCRSSVFFFFWGCVVVVFIYFSWRNGNRIDAVFNGESVMTLAVRIAGIGIFLLLQSKSYVIELFECLLWNFIIY